MFRLDRNKQKTNRNSCDSLIESIFWYFSENLGLFRFVSKQFCLFKLFRYRFETPKQIEIFVIGFMNKPKHNRNRFCFCCFGSNVNFFLIRFEDTLYVTELVGFWRILVVHLCAFKHVTVLRNFMVNSGGSSLCFQACTVTVLRNFKLPSFAKKSIMITTWRNLETVQWVSPKLCRIKTKINCYGTGHWVMDWVGGGEGLPHPPPTPLSRFHNNLCKDDSALFSRFLLGSLLQSCT
jgi:hypothetical protein